jgi:hypothetical protein
MDRFLFIIAVQAKIKMLLTDAVKSTAKDTLSTSLSSVSAFSDIKESPTGKSLSSFFLMSSRRIR